MRYDQGFRVPSAVLHSMHGEVGEAARRLVSRPRAVVQGFARSGGRVCRLPWSLLRSNRS